MYFHLQLEPSIWFANPILSLVYYILQRIDKKNDVVPLNELKSLCDTPEWPSPHLKFVLPWEFCYHVDIEVVFSPFAVLYLPYTTPIPPLPHSATKLLTRLYLHYELISHNDLQSPHYAFTHNVSCPFM